MKKHKLLKEDSTELKVKMVEDHDPIYSVPDSTFTDYLTSFNDMVKESLHEDYPGDATLRKDMALSEADKLHMTPDEIQKRNKEIEAICAKQYEQYLVDSSKKYKQAKLKFEALLNDTENPLLRLYFLFKYYKHTHASSIYIPLASKNNYLPKFKDLQKLMKQYGYHPLMLAIWGFYYARKYQRASANRSAYDINHLSAMFFIVARLHVKELMGAFAQDVSSYGFPVLAPNNLQAPHNPWWPSFPIHINNYIRNDELDAFIKEQNLPAVFKRRIVWNLEKVIELKNEQVAQMQQSHQNNPRNNNNSNQNSNQPPPLPKLFHSQQASTPYHSITNDLLSAAHKKIIDKKQLQQTDHTINNNQENQLLDSPSVSDISMFTPTLKSSQSITQSAHDQSEETALLEEIAQLKMMQAYVQKHLPLAEQKLAVLQEKTSSLFKKST